MVKIKRYPFIKMILKIFWMVITIMVKRNVTIQVWYSYLSEYYLDNMEDISPEKAKKKSFLTTYLTAYCEIRSCISGFKWVDVTEQNMDCLSCYSSQSFHKMEILNLIYWTNDTAHHKHHKIQAIHSVMQVPVRLVMIQNKWYSPSQT